MPAALPLSTQQWESKVKQALNDLLQPQVQGLTVKTCTARAVKSLQWLCRPAVLGLPHQIQQFFE